MYAPRARVIVSSLTNGPERRALIVGKVNDAGAWLVRTSDGRRLTVSESQLRPNNKAKVSDMKFTVEIDMSNAAFEDPMELARIVAKIARRVEGEDNAQSYVSVSSPIFDANGNNVGRWELGDYS